MASNVTDKSSESTKPTSSTNDGRNNIREPPKTTSNETSPQDPQAETSYLTDNEISTQRNNGFLILNQITFGINEAKEIPPKAKQKRERKRKVEKANVITSPYKKQRIVKNKNKSFTNKKTPKVTKPAPKKSKKSLSPVSSGNEE